MVRFIVSSEPIWLWPWLNYGKSIYAERYKCFLLKFTRVEPRAATNDKKGKSSIKHKFKSWLEEVILLEFYEINREVLSD